MKEKKTRTVKEPTIRSEKSASNEPDYHLEVTKKETWQGLQYKLKVIHVKEKYNEAVATCKEDKLDKAIEKLQKEYKRLGTIKVIRKDLEDVD